jgi:hypothetical protein
MTITPILFIGPVRAGKSTLAGLLASRLNLPHVSFDDLRWKYYSEIGYDADLAKQIRAQGGFLARMFYWQLFDVYSVERVLGDHPEAVIDFGAGVGPYESQEQLKRLRSVLELIPNIFLLLPSPDMDEALEILRQRDANPPADLKFDINAHFLRHPGYKLLAKYIIYTKNKTPDESAAEVLVLLK